MTSKTIHTRRDSLAGHIAPSFSGRRRSQAYGQGEHNAFLHAHNINSRMLKLRSCSSSHLRQPYIYSSSSCGSLFPFLFSTRSLLRANTDDRQGMDNTDHIHTHIHRHTYTHRHTYYLCTYENSLLRSFPSLPPSLPPRLFT